jgi:hypothetical protein
VAEGGREGERDQNVAHAHVTLIKIRPRYLLRLRFRLATYLAPSVTVAGPYPKH